MAQTIASFDTAHSAPIHDAQLDYYGKKLATASADNTIRIWDVTTEKQSFLAELKGHESSVLQVCWSHPKFGNLVASCSFDKTVSGVIRRFFVLKVMIWREGKGPGSPWEMIHKDYSHTSSVNSLAFAPWEFGLILATASSDGSIGLLTYKGAEGWTRTSIPSAHINGVNSVSWCPATSPAALSSGPATQQATLAPKRLVSGGSDNQIHVWELDECSGEWRHSQQMLANAHSDWVRDVAWRPNVGIPTHTIAACSEDGTVSVWTQESRSQPWSLQHRLSVHGPAWRVSWSVTGSILAVSCGDNSVELFKENSESKWINITNMNEQGVIITPEAR